MLNLESFFTSFSRYRPKWLVQSCWHLQESQKRNLDTIYFWVVLMSKTKASISINFFQNSKAFWKILMHEHSIASTNLFIVNQISAAAMLCWHYFVTCKVCRCFSSGYLETPLQSLALKISLSGHWVTLLVIKCHTLLFKLFSLFKPM